MSSPWQRYMSADVTSGGELTASTYCPVCSPVYSSAQYQRYAVPHSVNNGCCRRPDVDLDVFRPPTHSPDLLGPLPDTSGSSTLQPCSAMVLRAASCSAPDLIELSARFGVDQQVQHHVDEDEHNDCVIDSHVPCVTSFPARHASHSTAVVCEQVSPSRRRHRTVNDDDWVITVVYDGGVNNSGPAVWLTDWRHWLVGSEIFSTCVLHRTPLLYTYCPHGLQTNCKFKIRAFRPISCCAHECNVLLRVSEWV